jgi:CDP-2,3-bis-(O-geranylgeranyl)-sn-glycerol synthase
MYFANMAPVLVKKIPFLDSPIDGNRLLNGQRLFGKNKTWRGILFATLFGFSTIIFQQWLNTKNTFFSSISILDYESGMVLLLGGLMGFGAIMGDLIKSFFKRRMNIASGRPWVPFDQIDLAIGGLAFGSLLYWPGLAIAAVILLITPILHWITNLFAYFLGMKEVPW